MRPELIRATELLRLNNREAVEEAVALLQNTVYSFSMKVCGHSEDAEDTTQEVLFRSLEHLAKLQDPRQLSVWLYTVTKNRCWRMRRKSVHAPKQMLSLAELMPSDEELGMLLQDAGKGPERNLLDAEQHHLLHQAILLIPGPLRIVLVLHDMEELTTEEVAQILQLQQGTVRIRLHRARLSVRKKMNELLIQVHLPEDALHGQKGTAKGRRPKRVSRPDACIDLFANLSEYMDGRIEPVACEQMRTHIEACPSCVAFLRDLRCAIDRCRSLEVPSAPNVASRLRNLLTQEYLRMLVQPTQK